ncbi:MAG TPA: hypothetical protein VGI43_11580, partial [Mucilaginibacter sp.]
YIPKAGVQEAYVDNKAYEGDKRLIIGKIHVSEKKLPPLDQNRLNKLEQYFAMDTRVKNILPSVDSVNVSFLSPTQVFNFEKVAQTVQNVKLSGNIILVSDTTVIIDNTAVLDNTMVFARAIIVKSGFRGNCQLFATDSISVENNCCFDYPSCLGVLHFGSSVISSIEKISIGEGTEFSGIIFSYEKTEKPIKPLIQLGKNVKIKGQVYSQGNLELKDQAEVDGSIFASSFLYKSSFTRFENYLINVTIDSKALSPYYLTVGLLPVSGKKKVLQWLEAN